MMRRIADQEEIVDNNKYIKKKKNEFKWRRFYEVYFVFNQKIFVMFCRQKKNNKQINVLQERKKKKKTCVSLFKKKKGYATRKKCSLL